MRMESKSGTREFAYWIRGRLIERIILRILTVRIRWTAGQGVGREGFAIGVKSGGIASGFLEKVGVYRAKPEVGGKLGRESAGIQIEV